MSGLDLERLVLSGGPLGYGVMGLTMYWGQKTDIPLKIDASSFRLCYRIYS